MQRPLLTGRLFSLDLRASWYRLSCPVIIAYGSHPSQVKKSDAIVALASWTANQAIGRDLLRAISPDGTDLRALLGRDYERIIAHLEMPISAPALQVPPPADSTYPGTFQVAQAGATHTLSQQGITATNPNANHYAGSGAAFKSHPDPMVPGTSQQVR